MWLNGVGHCDRFGGSAHLNRVTPTYLINSQIVTSKWHHEASLGLLGQTIVSTSFVINFRVCYSRLARRAEAVECSTVSIYSAGTRSLEPRPHAVCQHKEYLTLRSSCQAAVIPSDRARGAARKSIRQGGSIQPRSAAWFPAVAAPLWTKSF